MVGPTARKRRDEELARLKAEATAARERIDGTVSRMRAEVHDPYGIRTAITSHPFVTAGVATGLGLAVAKLFAGRTSDRPNAPTRFEFWAGRLLDGGLQVLKPLGAVYLRKWLSDFAPATAGACTPSAEPSP